MAFKHRYRARPSGFSLIETMVAVMILGVCVVLTGAGTNLMADMLREQRITETQREVQMTLDQFNEDIRGCQSIVAISTDSLVLRVFDNRVGYQNPQIFNPVTFGTVTYRYTGQGDAHFVSRKVEFPGRTLVRSVLRNALATPTAAEPLFAPYPAGASAPYSAVSASIRLQMPFKIPKSTYSIVMTRRRFFDQ